MGAVQNLIASTGTAAEWEVVALAFISRARCLRASKAITAHLGTTPGTNPCIPLFYMQCGLGWGSWGWVWGAVWLFVGLPEYTSCSFQVWRGRKQWHWAVTLGPDLIL